MNFCFYNPRNKARRKTGGTVANTSVRGDLCKLNQNNIETKFGMIVLFISAVIGFAIGRVISIVASQLFQQRFDLNVRNARTLIVLGSGGELQISVFLKKKTS